MQKADLAARQDEAARLQAQLSREQQRVQAESERLQVGTKDYLPATKATTSVLSSGVLSCMAPCCFIHAWSNACTYVNASVAWALDQHSGDGAAPWCCHCMMMPSLVDSLALLCSALSTNLLTQELADSLSQRERKASADRSELDQQRRFQERQAAQLVKGTAGGAQQGAQHNRRPRASVLCVMHTPLVPLLSLAQH